MKQILTLLAQTQEAAQEFKPISIHPRQRWLWALRHHISYRTKYARSNRAFDLPTDLIDAQIDAIFSDFDVAALKTGMLSSVEIVEAVAKNCANIHQITL